MPNNQFVVKPKSEWNPKGLWDWEIQLADDAQLDDIASVTYGLHPAFPNPNRIVHERANGFRLKMSSAIAQNETWGRFDVRVTILMKDGRREYQSVPLEFMRPDGVPAPDLLPLPATADFALCKVYFGYLNRKGAYGYAREVLGRALELLSDPAVRNQAPDAVLANLNWVYQKLALCTYKDPSLPGDTRLRDALAILVTNCKLDLKFCLDPETLGLAGAVYKRMWEASRVRSHLELSLAYYRRGYEVMMARPLDKDHDRGAFTGINVVYVCEILAMEIPEDIDPVARKACIDEADRMRSKLAVDLPTHPNQSDWWIGATLLDVLLCLACSDPTKEEPLKAQAKVVEGIDASPWEVESSGSQLLRSARLQKQLARGRGDDIDALLARTLDVAFRGMVAPPDRAGTQGKMGLGLSGGGFRASLFHIGVLARMAELDLLRHVEVISCVSGGSIVGAHYYLLLRNLLQKTPDNLIKRTDYIEIVEALLKQFLAGVQKNIRMSVAGSLWANLRMIFQPSHYSRTQRLGELYEKHLYSQVEDGDEKHERWLNEAFIVPLDKDGKREEFFSPKLENWRRRAKVPMLVLNATTLNTGRNWQFTASYMGEPQSYGTSADATERLEAVYYSEAPDRWQRYRLGEAVAASSCVPALFTPIVLPELFKGRVVRLVDGGVHDNQGTRSLLDQDCEYVVVSDASGQMDSLTNPPHGELGVALRTNSVLQARVRIAQNQELQARVLTGQLRECDFLHLRKELERAVQSASTAGSAVASTDAPMAPGDLTSYGVERRVQAALAGIRTDLDSFTDREALCLMLSGYRMAEKYLAPDLKVESHKTWRFLDVADACAGKGQDTLAVDNLLHHLQVGSKLPFKVWFLNPVLNAIRILLLGMLGVGAFVGLIYLWRHDVKIPLDHRSIDLGGIAGWILALVIPILIAVIIPVGKALAAKLKPALNPGSVVTRIIAGAAMACGGWLLCRLHIVTFDRLFLWMGRVKPTTRT